MVMNTIQKCTCAIVRTDVIHAMTYTCSDPDAMNRITKHVMVKYLPKCNLFVVTKKIHIYEHYSNSPEVPKNYI